ncbi:hypothetical protein EC844_13212 [Acinetobacter calcoaceticus]|uniref:Uncharacterized protein n=1 Tax=Acinetobacter calcoaceticus TaxID=471 RepID=A0A4R1XG84_ACICA|nr:hypothetical protein EC844_13212 [Acinetobacter calcoaceticus]
MKKLLGLSTVMITAITLGACATTPTQGLAIQKENNQYEVTGVGKTQLIAKNNAIAAANSTCGKRAAPIMINEQTKYSGALNGVVDEQTGQLITAAAGVLGSALGKPNSLEKDTDYQSVLTFSCKAAS